MLAGWLIGTAHANQQAQITAPATLFSPTRPMHFEDCFFHIKQLLPSFTTIKGKSHGSVR
jgi:hypothetical protein